MSSWPINHHIKINYPNFRSGTLEGKIKGVFIISFQVFAQLNGQPAIIVESNIHPSNSYLKHIDFPMHINLGRGSWLKTFGILLGDILTCKLRSSIQANNFENLDDKPIWYWFSKRTLTKSKLANTNKPQICPLNFIIESEAELVRNITSWADSK